MEFFVVFFFYLDVSLVLAFYWYPTANLLVCYNIMSG